MIVADEEKIGTVVRAYCSKCGGERNCEVRGYYLETGGDDEGFYQWRTEWFLLTCRGCDHVFAQSIATNSEDYTQYYDDAGDTVTEHLATIETWPARSKRRIPEWFEHSVVETDAKETSALNASLRELYGALDADLMVLASIGIRTSFDIAAEVLGIESGLTFQQKLKALVDKGHILEAEKENIETLIEAGSASAHRGWSPTSRDLDALMNALEDFIYGALVFPAKKRAKEANLAKVKARVPKRAPRKPQSPRKVPSTPQGEADG